METPRSDVAYAMAKIVGGDVGLKMYEFATQLEVELIKTQNTLLAIELGNQQAIEKSSAPLDTHIPPEVPI